MKAFFRTRLTLGLAGVLLTSTLFAGESLDIPKLRSVDQAVQKAVDEGTIVGGAVWIEQKGEVYSQAFGNRALRPELEPMTEDTIFDLASITKAMATASAAMLCVERGLFDLDVPVSQYLPEFSGEGREKITVRHLLLHTSGLPLNLKTEGLKGHEDAIAQFCQAKLMFEPGSEFAYSSVGSMVLAVAIEKVTGQRFDGFCQENLYQPLGMNDTVFRPSETLLPRVAPSSAPKRGWVDDQVARLAGGVEGHASLFSTTGDMARFARMLLKGGELEGVRVLKPETVALMTSVQSPPELPSGAAKHLVVKRGLGWDINTPYRTPPHPYSRSRGALFPVGGFGHTGWTGQMIWIDPHSQTFVIFLCNRYGPNAKGSPSAVYDLHHQISTIAAQSVKAFDFGEAPSTSR